MMPMSGALEKPLMIRPLIAAALLMSPLPALAQTADEPAANPPQRIKSLSLRPGEPCPRSTADEVVVCRTIEDPYRIPKELRQVPAQTPESTAWAVRNDRVMEDNQKVLPGSCSPIGSYGQSGCAQQAAEQWIAERRLRVTGQAVEPPPQ